MMGRERLAGRDVWRTWLVAAAWALTYLALGAGAAMGEEAVPDAPPAPAADKDAVPSVPAPPPAPAAPEAPKGAVAPAGEGKIELHLKDEEVANAFELLSVQYKLNLVVSKSAKGKVSADLYNITIDQAMDAICRAANLTWAREGDCIYVQTAEEMSAIKMDESRLTTQVFHLNYLTSEEALKLIAPALSTKATSAASTAAETGISAEGGTTGGNSLGVADTVIVRDFPENLTQVAEILKKMDRRPRQVFVEATILRVTLDDDTSLGVNFNALAGVDFRDLTTLATPAPATADMNPATVATNASQTARASTPPWGQVNTQGFAARGNGLNIGVITNNVSVFINALEEAHDTTVLSNPKVLALNKQTAEVNVGDQIGYRGETTQTETANTQDVQFMDIGTRLAFRPFISEDGYVRLEVHPEVSQRGAETIDNIPSKSTVEATCNVMVKDGHTIVIGGLFEETADIDRQQVPGLGNIPLLGWLFRSNGNTTTRGEIIILLTPHIIDDDEAADAISQQTLADGKRRCLGMREGFSFFARERITTGYVDEADRAWRSYATTRSPKDMDRAWWNVRLALNVAPNNLAAMRLHDQILTEKNGAPYEPPNWTIWDTIHDRVRAAFGPQTPKAGKDQPPVPDAQTGAGPEPASKEADHAR